MSVQTPAPDDRWSMLSQQVAQLAARVDELQRQPTALRCQCEVELDKTRPIEEFGVAESPQSVFFRPNYSKKPACRPADHCETGVEYEWTFTPTEGQVEGRPWAPENRSTESLEVLGPGAFKLCIKVKVKCRRRINTIHGVPVFRVTRCEDSQCDEFEIDKG